MMYAYMLSNSTNSLRRIEAGLWDKVKFAIHVVVAWMAAVSFSKDFTFEIRVLYYNFVVKLC